MAHASSVTINRSSLHRESCSGTISGGRQPPRLPIGYWCIIATFCPSAKRLYLSKSSCPAPLSIVALLDPFWCYLLSLLLDSPMIMSWGSPGWGCAKIFPTIEEHDCRQRMTAEKACAIIHISYHRLAAVASGNPEERWHLMPEGTAS